MLPIIFFLSLYNLTGLAYAFLRIKASTIVSDNNLRCMPFAQG